MKKNTFETRSKSFLERSFNKHDQGNILRYIIMIGFTVYAYQFYYFDYSWWRPLSEGFVFYFLLFGIYQGFLKAGKIKQKLVFEEDSISIVTEEFSSSADTHDFQTPMKTKNIEKIWVKDLQSLSIIQNGPFSWKGVAFSKRSPIKSDQSTRFFYLDTNEITHLEYFLQKNFLFKEFIKKDSAQFGVKEIWGLIPRDEKVKKWQSIVKIKNIK